MPDRVLNRYTLDARQPELDSLYPGAEVWLVALSEMMNGELR